MKKVIKQEQANQRNGDKNEVAAIHPCKDAGNCSKSKHRREGAATRLMRVMVKEVDAHKIPVEQSKFHSGDKLEDVAK